MRMSAAPAVTTHDVPPSGVTAPTQIACGGSGFPLGTLDGPPDYVALSPSGASGQVAKVRVFGMDMITGFDREKEPVRSSTGDLTATVQDWTRGLRDAVKLEEAESKKPGYMEGPAELRLAGFPSALEKAAQLAAATKQAVFVDGYRNVYIGTVKGTGAETKINVSYQVKYYDGNGNPQAPTLPPASD